jgi:DNA-binding beta-propeller fold protein YncE
LNGIVWQVRPAAKPLAALPIAVALLALLPFSSSAAAPVIDSALVLSQANGQRDFNGPLGIAVDPAHGEVVVANTGEARIEFFDFRTFPRGSYVHRVADEGGDPRDGRPSQLAFDAAGYLLVSDLSVPYVDVLDYRGRRVAKLTLPAPDDVLAAGGGPGALAVGRDGTILVASRGNRGRVHVFGPDYRHRASWGTPGSAAGQLNGITGLAETAQGEVVVACVYTDLAVQVFDSAGAYRRGWGVHDIGPGNFSYPSGVTVTEDGRIWVSDAIRQVIQVFDPAGTYLGAVGGSGLGPGEFTYPSALASDGRGMLALVESMGNRLQLIWVR